MSTYHFRALYRDIWAARDRDNQQNGTTGMPNATTTDYPFDPYADHYRGSSEPAINRNAITLVLFILFLFCTIVLVCLRIPCCYRRFQASSNRRRSSSSRRSRTQESIEEILLLKKVEYVDGKKNNGDLDLEKGGGAIQRIKRKIERRKSNLRLTSDAQNELDESRTCPICLCEYEHGDNICWSPNPQCPHHFHTQCGVAWLAKHTECPICRAEYLEAPKKSTEIDCGATTITSPACSRHGPPMSMVAEDRESSIDTDASSSSDIDIQMAQEEEQLESSSMDQVEESNASVDTESCPADSDADRSACEPEEPEAKRVNDDKESSSEDDGQDSR